MSNAVLQLIDIKKTFATEDGQQLKAVNGVSLSVNKGERVAIVGESGCGKSTMAKLITHIEDSTEGTILFHGHDVTTIDKKQLREYRKQVQMVFQQPSEVFSPRMKVGTFLMEPWINYEKKSRREAKEEALKALAQVKLPAEYFHKYPHMLSGGELQRVAIARAINLKPEILICDEATSALDVSIQKEIVQLLGDMQKKSDFAILMISHDLALAEEFCDKVAVMYLGRIVEMMPCDCLLKEAQHPYTKALLRSVLRVHEAQSDPIRTLEGEPPSPVDVQSGCSFCGRCTYAKDICKTTVPKLHSIAEGHAVACHCVE